MPVFYLFLVFFVIIFIINIVNIYRVWVEDREKIFNDNSNILRLLGAITLFILICIFLYRIIFW